MINFTNSKTLVGRCRDRPSRALPLTCPNVKNFFKKYEKIKKKKRKKKNEKKRNFCKFDQKKEQKKQNKIIKKNKNMTKK